MQNEIPNIVELLLLGTASDITSKGTILCINRFNSLYILESYSYI